MPILSSAVSQGVGGGLVPIEDFDNNTEVLTVNLKAADDAIYGLLQRVSACFSLLLNYKG